MNARPTPWTLDSTDVKVFSFTDVVDSLSKEDAFTQYGKNACTLVRSPKMRSLVIAIEAGKSLDEHEAPGPVTIALLKGRVRFQGADPNKSRELAPGDVAVMTADARHAVTALERSIFLVVIGGDEKGTSASA